MPKKLPEVEPDGLPIDDVKQWAESKYRLVWTYSSMFATAMRVKWDRLNFIALFAASGFSKFTKTNRIVPNASLLAMEIPHPFDRYVFCELREDAAKAIGIRALRHHSTADVRIIQGDLNSELDKISEVIQPQPGFRRVLSFCFVDPFNLGNLKFVTVERLSKFFVDFLVLIPSYMDANRNEANYLRPEDKTIDEFLGNSDWRDDWANVKLARKYPFGEFVAYQFGISMKGLNYEFNGLQDMKLVRRPENNLPLYHLSFFSRNPLGTKFWREALKYSTDQLSFL